MLVKTDNRETEEAKKLHNNYDSKPRTYTCFLQPKFPTFFYIKIHLLTGDSISRFTQDEY